MGNVFYDTIFASGRKANTMVQLRVFFVKVETIYISIKQIKNFTFFILSMCVYYS